MNITWFRAGKHDRVRGNLARKARALHPWGYRGIDELERRQLLTSYSSTVGATANIFGAGHADAPAPGGGGAGVLPPIFQLPSGSNRNLTFSSVTGQVSPVGSGAAGFHGADGGPEASGDTDITSAGGISGIIHANRTMFLVGVFLTDSEPSGAGPDRLSFSDGQDFTELSPEIGQTFFIGDGLSAGGSTQVFHVPAGATRLALGFADAVQFGNPTSPPGYYYDNYGSLDVAFDVEPKAIPRDAPITTPTADPTPPAADPGNPRKGVQLVLLGKWNDKSINRFIKTVKASNIRAIEVGFVWSFGTPKRVNQIATKIIKAFTKQNITVTLAVHLTYDEAPINKLTKWAKQFSKFATPYASNEKVRFKLSPRLEDTWSDTDYKSNMQTIIAGVDSQLLASSRFRLLRSPKPDNKTATAQAITVTVNGSPTLFTSELEIHGNPEDAPPRSAQSYSNDGVFVYSDQDFDHKGGNDETETSAVNASTDFKVTLPLSKFSQRLNSDGVTPSGFKGTVLLWRPAYNLYPGTQNKQGVWSYNTNRNDKAVGLAGDRQDNRPIPAFSPEEASVLAYFLSH